ncbi:MAG: hypothetical protein H7Y17_17480 [Chlorobia bacterium]|nr:hypothetical protein [Fimbriimonadaceae bacterium]
MSEIISAEIERKLAVSLYNRCWSLIESPGSPERDDELERSAFASLFHWSRVGDAKNLAIGEWMIAHMYLLLGRFGEAERFARRVIDVCGANGLEDFHLAYGYLEMARIERARGNADSAADWVARAKAVEIPDAEDREHFDEDLAPDGW